MSDMNEELMNHVKDERVFLHDMSNKLVVANGMTSFILRNLDSPDDLDKLLDRGQKALAAINSMIELIQERRKILHSINSD